MVHRAFARDVQRLAKAVGEPNLDNQRVLAIWASWDLFHTLLEHHHQAEDDSLWPTLLTNCPDSVGVIGLMEQQHHALDAVLGTTNEAMSAWRDAPSEASGSVAGSGLVSIAALLDEHLTAEESQALPLIAEHLTAAEWGLFTASNMQRNKDVVWTMPWLTEGKPLEVREPIWSFLSQEVLTGPAVEWANSYSANVATAFATETPEV